MTIYTVRPNLYIHLNGNIYSNGQTVDLTPEQYQDHAHKLVESVPNGIPTQGNGGANNNSSVTSVSLTLANLTADTWTALPVSGFTKDVDFKVFRNNDEITETLDFRRAGNSFEICSINELNNLTIEIEGEN